ncbi:acyltransferase domain-containing protein, partial [Saccharothrix sp. MB29]|nr:acyltransferase domain-containing protein [Saccharothrix sp. MB29]
EQRAHGHECDVALAGGVTITPRHDWGYLHEPGGILSPDGTCRPFDAAAAGTVPSEGVGVVVLKRLEEALREGDRIAAVLLGSAINNDGGEKMGYTAPSLRGQSEVVHYAQQVADVDPADLDYVEAHGTATRIGDPVEVQALTDVFRGSTDATGSCLIGAVKSNLGHTGAAAGVAGLIKVALMLEHREVVPTLHYTRPNPLLELETTPFRVARVHEPWPDRGVPLAAVSAFGIGGTNVHVVLGAAPDRIRPVASGPRVVPVSASTPEALAGIRLALADNLAAVGTGIAPGEGAPGEGALGEVALGEVARTLAGRRAHTHRRAVVAGDLAEAADLLRSPDPGGSPPLTTAVFLFPGQGVLRDAAGAAAHRLLDGFRDHFDRIADAVRTAHGLDLTPVVADAGDREWFEHTVHQQVGLFALGCALGRQLADWGVRPSALFGNSVGEYTAAALAGVWTSEEAAGLVHERAAAMWRTEPGAMAAVDASRDDVLPRLEGHPGVSVAITGPGRTVLAGGPGAMRALLDGDDLRGFEVRPLTTVRAFHTPAMKPAAAALGRLVAATPAKPPTVPMISNETGDWAEGVTAPDYWTNQMLRRVRLDDGARTLLAAGHGTYLELGPGASMSGTLRRHPDWSAEHSAVPLLGGDRDVLRALAALWERGVDGALEHADDGSLRRSLPTHPFTAAGPDRGGAPRPRVVVAERRPGTLADIWTSALGVASAADTDDFRALGGDSLMLVDLLARVRDRTGRTVPLAEFQADPTFGVLTRLVGGEPPPGVVTFGAGRPGSPLFLVADATGTTEGCRALAELLDVPVHGLEPDGPVDDVAVLAAQHVRRLRAVRPEGPYTVGGWSFGAVVAHEVACLLRHDGAEVDLLVCLDGYVPVVGRPLGTDPGHLFGVLRALTGAAFGLDAFGRRLRRAPAVRRRFLAGVAALPRHRPGRPDFPVAAFLARGTGQDVRRLREVYRHGAQVHAVGGDHWSMLADPHVHQLADRLRSVLHTRENR